MDVPSISGNHHNLSWLGWICDCRSGRLNLSWLNDCHRSCCLWLGSRLLDNHSRAVWGCDGLCGWSWSGLNHSWLLDRLLNGDSLSCRLSLSRLLNDSCGAIRKSDSLGGWSWGSLNDSLLLCRLLLDNCSWTILKLHSLRLWSLLNYSYLCTIWVCDGLCFGLFWFN